MHSGESEPVHTVRFTAETGAFAEIPVTEWGPVVLASHPFSDPWTNGMILGMLPEEDRAEAAELIGNTGVRTRYFRDMTRIPDPEQVTEDAARKGAMLVRRVMDRKGWDRIDALIDTSAVLPLDFSARLSETLGFSPDSLTRRSVRTACSGVVTALTDALADPELSDGSRVVILAAEPLSSVVGPNVFSKDHVGIPAIFGDDFAAIALNPSDFELVSVKSVVIPDHGVIRIRPFYEPPLHVPSSVPAHYVLEDGADAVFSATPAGVFMRYQPPDGGFAADMNGSATAKFFIRHTPPVIRSVLLEAMEKGVIPTNVIAHQPSLPVVDGINRVLERSGFPQRIRFLLTEMGRSNSSSATTAVSWQYQARHGLIRPDEATLVVAPGIGSMISAAVIRLKNTGYGV